MRKPAFFIRKNKGADQLRGKCADQLRGKLAADQHLCFHYKDSTILLLPKPRSHLLWLYSLVCVRPSQKPQRQFFSLWGSYRVNVMSFVWQLMEKYKGLGPLQSCT